MTIFLGLTGSIGMGKSTTAGMFAEAGIPVHDSDATVHDLYAGEAVNLVEAAFSGVTVGGVIDREKLSARVVGEEEAMKKLEQIIHPLVRAKEISFRQSVEDQGTKLAILDVPLLFETGGDERVDGIVVVTAPADVQRERVLSRDGMTVEKFEAILARQVPDDVKRSRADFIVDTSLGLETAQSTVLTIVDQVTSGAWQPTKIKNGKNDA